MTRPTAHSASGNVFLRVVSLDDQVLEEGGRDQSGRIEPTAGSRQ